MGRWAEEATFKSWVINRGTRLGPFLRWPDGSKYTGNFEANNLPGTSKSKPFKKRIRINMTTYFDLFSFIFSEVI